MYIYIYIFIYLYLFIYFFIYIYTCILFKGLYRALIPSPAREGVDQATGGRPVTRSRFESDAGFPGKPSETSNSRVFFGGVEGGGGFRRVRGWGFVGGPKP